jgi:hypothetical protein
LEPLSRGGGDARGYGADVTIFLAWTAAEVPVETLGPWRELWPAAPGLLLVDSDDTLSRVYHELKWSLPDGTALAVVPIDAAPKAKGLAPGTQAWWSDRLGR